MKKTKDFVPLIAEPHPSDYQGYPFITLIQYNDQQLLTVVDEIDDKAIQAYVLDLCGPTTVDQHTVLTIAEWWHHNKKDTMPLSIVVSQLNLTEQLSKIHRKFTTDFITRVIGPIPDYTYKSKTNIRRRKRKDIPNGVEVIYRH